MPEIPRTSPHRERGPIVFFDGACHLCNGTVDALLRRDRNGILRFAPLQGSTFADLSAIHRGLPTLDAMIVADDAGLHVKSAAVIRALRALGGAWGVCAVLLWLVPRPLRDRVYDAVARRRYGWFAPHDSCRLPTPELRARFLE